MTHLAQVRWASDPDHIAARINDHLRADGSLATGLARHDPTRSTYESLVADPEANARELVAWCGLRVGPSVSGFPRDPPPRPHGERRRGAAAGSFPFGRPLEEL